MGRTPLICLTFVACCQPVSSLAEETSTPGELRTDSTPNSISIEWDLAGDSNHDATCNVQ